MKIKLLSVAVIASISALTLTACSGGGSSAAAPSVSSSPFSLTLPSHNSSIYNASTNGPAYNAIQVNANTTFTVNSFSIDSSGPVSLVAPTDAKVYGSLTPCTSGLTLQNGQECYIFMHADKTYNQLFKNPGSMHQTVTINTSNGTAYADVHSQGFLYIAGDFDRLGTASIPAGSGETMLAKCSFPTSIDQLSCSNALSGTNHANAGIFTLGSDSAGNVYAGGRFDQLGNVSTSNGENLLAKYNPSTADLTNAFNNNGNPANPTYNTNTEIDAITFDDTDNMYITGDITNAGGTSATPGASIDMQFLLAKCDLTKNSNQCTNTNGDNVLSNLSANYVDGNPIYALGLFTNNTTPYLLAGGGMDAIGGTSVTYGGSCALNTTGIASACNEFPGGGASPSSDIIYSILVDNANRAAYVGGVFTQIGSLNYPSQFLAKCSLSTTGLGACTGNALGSGAIYVTGGQGTSFATPLIRATALDNGGDVFLAGKFDTITDGTNVYANASTGNNLIARCPIGSTSPANHCQNLLSADVPNDGADNIVDSMTTNAEITDVSVRVSN